MMSLDEIFCSPLPALEGEFGFTPWPAPSPTPTPSACPEEADQDALSPAEERRRRRRISNRESARRSRMRKQRHLEELRSQAGRLRSENQDLADWLVDVSHGCLLFRSENDRLRAESGALHRRLSELHRRLSELHRLLVLQQLRLLSSPPPSGPVAASGGFASAYEQSLASLIA